MKLLARTTLIFIVSLFSVDSYSDEILSPKDTSVFEVTFGHFNSDRKADLIVRNTSNGNLYVHLNNTTNWSFYADYSQPVTVGSPDWEFLFADINGDGRDDVINREKNGGAMYLHLNLGGAFSTVGAYIGGSPGGSEWKTYLKDVSGDRKADLCNIYLPNGQLYVQANLGGN
jgi:hypothetical protein